MMPPLASRVSWGFESADGDDSRSDAVPLPLNLIALIISYLDEPADLARACRTSRILHYMCLPQLYANVSLHSYDHIRYSDVDNKPEGCGGASPFSMGLNALVVRNVATYVKKFRVWGQWKEYELEDHAKVGRVPDGSMMLNLLIRAAVDRMPCLETFSWELDTKMLSTVWLGLAQKPTLESLTVKFPSLRFPRPTLNVPPFANLKELSIKNIDPLCYPDNISQMLLGSKKLETLKLHWNPRMREQREASVSFHQYFTKITCAEYKMRLKNIAFQNLYAFNEDVFQDIVDTETAESFTMINSMTGEGDSADMAFVDASWRTAPPKANMPSLRMLRGNKVSSMHCQMLWKFSGLHYYYLLSGRKLKDRPFGNADVANSSSSGSSNGVTSAYNTPRSQSSHTSASNGPTQTPTTPATPIDPPAAIPRLGQDYLDAIVKRHGPTLRHLLLPPQWRLLPEDIARLVHGCPNLEQLGLGVEISNFSILRLLIPFLPKLHAIRVLDPPEGESLTDHMIMSGDQWQEHKIEEETGKVQFHRLKWVGLGALVFEVTQSVMADDNPDDRGPKFTRVAKRRPLESVRDVPIWSMDRLEI